MVSVPADIDIVNIGSPSCDVGRSDNAISDPDDGHKVPSLKEIVTKELLVLKQQKRLSVREIAKRFEKGQPTTTKASVEEKWKEMASLDRQVLINMFRDLLETLKARVAERNKDDVEEAISKLEALVLQLAQSDGEFLQEKSEIKKTAYFLIQYAEDTKKVIDNEKAVAYSVIETTKQVVHRVTQSQQEYQLISGDVKRHMNMQNQDELKSEIQEARRIIMLHQPSKVMDMEHECKALRMQLTEKHMQLRQLRKEIALKKPLIQNNSSLFELDGLECLGSCLRVVPCSPEAPDFVHCSIQWFRVLADENRKVLISGATKQVYAPEPFDVGQILMAEISFEDERVNVTTTGPVDEAPGLTNYVEALVRNTETHFIVVVLQVNGKACALSSTHIFHVGATTIKLRKKAISVSEEAYSTSMQICGMRGGGNAAALTLFWQAKEGLSYALAFESDRERNTAIMLARRYASDRNVKLIGPGDVHMFIT